MSACTGRHPAAADRRATGDGRKGMQMEAQS